MGPGAQRNAARAADAYRALQCHLAVGDGSGLYRERYPVAPGDNAYSYEWPFSQVHGATLDLAGLPGSQGTAYLDDLAARAVGQERYWMASGGATGRPGYASYPLRPYGPGGDLFYDDNEWVGLLDVQRYLICGDRQALARAEEIFELVASGWDSDRHHAFPGGVFWTQAGWSRDRNTVSNMPGAFLGLRLYLITGREPYLTGARAMYEWTNGCLLSPQGLYWDHISLDGAVETTFWSYNQGVPVGVNVLLLEATGDKVYLDRAARLAEASLAHYTTGTGLLSQPPYFNSIYFKNLLLLDAATGGHTFRDSMSRYADAVWDRCYDTSTGLFRFTDGTDGSGGNDARTRSQPAHSMRTQTLEQAAMVQIYAVLAWDPADYRFLY
ncbi:glycoside hydrolase family 76 protein [Streptomyces sp. RB6PN25]|uniref:Glycoside hydrolase family 76 protein n=1 Tax=Streptomyces humicola TaxID=2953240 RepID=A0ABT1Q0M4_9ACTN|nr:glycoside hydrolase family 76 protein [Streptomyces humicola]MCQ4083489.1 glycoside hydrolase family 76 protein [Streptomyces humicola]